MAHRPRFRLAPLDGGLLWFAVTIPGGWTACYKLRPQDGRPQVVELRVLPTPPGAVVNVRPDGELQGHHQAPSGGLTSGTLHSEVVMGRHVYELFPEWLREKKKGWLGTVFSRVGGKRVTWYEALFGSLGFDPEIPQRGRRGPKGWPDIDYARLAAAYLAAVDSGSRSPVADVARSRRMSDTALRHALFRARKRGLLTRQTTGRAGGELTARAKALLKGEKPNGEVK